MNRLLIEENVKSFLIEDIGEKDITAETIFPASQSGKAVFIAKESGIIAGLEIIEIAMQLISPNTVVQLLKKNGDTVKQAESIAIIEGPVQHILTGERVILNLLQRMSGIATLTRQAVNELRGSRTRICDTRKTTPGLRMFEKYAVTCGGGFNHRNGLYDGVMIKDNHIAFSGSITNAVKTVREKLGLMVKIEVEVETEAQVIEAVSSGCDIIMFDNATPQEIIAFKKHVPNHIITEASGNITLETIHQYGATGVDYISLGFLTHSYKSLDISLTILGGE